MVKKTFWRALIILMMVTGVFTISVPFAAALVPSSLSYEGRLTDTTGTALTGSYNMRFSISSDTAGASVVWGPEAHAAVSVSNGIFMVKLGETTALTTAIFSSPDRYIVIEVANPAGSSNYETITPLPQFVSVGYSFKAAEADIADDIANNSVTAAKIATGAVTSDAIAAGAVIDANIVSVSGSKVTGSVPPGAHASSHKVGGTDLLTIEAGMIVSGAVTSDAIAAGAVTTAEIADGSVTDAKIVSVSGSKVTGTVLPGAHASSHYAGSSDALAVSSNMIDDGAIIAAKIATGAVTADAIANTAVTAGTYGSGTTVAKYTVDAQGRLTSAESVVITVGGGISTAEADTRYLNLTGGGTVTGNVTADAFYGNGGGLTGLPAGGISTAEADTRYLNLTGGGTVTGNVTADAFYGSGASLTNLPSSGLTTADANTKYLQLATGGTVTGGVTVDAFYSTGEASFGGNVGIGTTSPTEALDVVGVVKTSNRFETGGIWIKDQGTYAEFRSDQTGDDIQFLTRASGGSFGPRMIIKDDGNIGIGTVTPGASLEVVGQVKITGGSPGLNKVLTSDNAGLASWQTAAGGGISTAEADTRYLQLSGGTVTGTLTAEGSAHFATTGGNVGIGTTNPEAKLHVIGGTSFGNILKVTDGIFQVGGELGSGRYIYHNYDGGPLTLQEYDEVRIGDYENMAIGTLFKINQNKFTFMNGNVGIGTETPGATLEVAGQVKIVDGTQAAGYVLTSDGDGLASWQAGGGGISTADADTRYLKLSGGGTVTGNITADAFYGDGANLTGVKLLSDASNNTSAGTNALTSNTTGSENSAVGNAALNANTTGSQNSAFGSGAGVNATGSGNVFLGYNAGANEGGNNKLYIANSDIATPLIGGDFTAGTVTINGALTTEGTVTVNGAYTFPSTDGTIGQALVTDGGGALSWTAVGGTPAGLDTEVQFNSSLAFGADSTFTFNSDKVLGINSLNIPVTVDLNTGTLQQGGVAILHTFGTNSIFLGAGAGAGNNFNLSAAAENAALGSNALYSNTDGGYNSALGSDALYSNTLGNYNSAMGYGALYSNVGDGTVDNGANNSAMGAFALYYNTTGAENAAVGSNALYSNTDGYNNAAVGVNALNLNTSGYYNSALGSYALEKNLIGNYNSALGYGALNANTADDNTAMGYLALATNTTGIYNTAVGSGALFTNDGSDPNGSYNTAVGYSALYSNTTGYYNSAVGESALYTNTEGYDNSAFGEYSLNLNSTGYENSAVGVNALALNDTGSQNSAFGTLAGYSSTGSGNVFLGYGAGFNELGNNTLYIANSDTITPLIGGDFSAGTVTFNGAYTFPSTDGTIGQALVTDGGATLSWAAVGGGISTAEADTRYLLLSGGTVTGTLTTEGSAHFATTGGNVGIGTTNPEAKLHVIGGTSFGNILKVTDGIFQVGGELGSGRYIYHNYDGGPLTLQEYDEIRIGDYENMAIGTLFKINQNKFTFMNGNVGIGTETPGATLEVAGQLKVVDGTQAAGYVLTSDGDGLASWQAGGGGISTADADTRYLKLSGGGTVTGNITADAFYGDGANLTGVKLLSDASNNTSAGTNALTSNTTGGTNSVVGRNALASNTTGSGNSAVGVNTLRLNTAGEQNSAVGSYALEQNTTGTNNSALGSGALNVSNADDNSAVGYSSLFSNTTGSGNSALGAQTLFSNTLGNNNSAVGKGALSSNDTGNFNSALGTYALSSNISGSYNSALGYQAGYLSTGEGNVFLGYKAGYNEAGDNKLYIENSNSAAPLIGGNFSARTVTINGALTTEGTVTVNGALDVTGTLTAEGSAHFATTGGKVGIGTADPTSKLQVVGLPAYADNATAIAGGLTVGAFYRTGGDPDLVCVVH